MSRLALGPTQPPIQWEPGVHSLGEISQVIKLTSHLHLVLRSRMSGAIHPLPSFPSWHGAQMGRSTGTTLLHSLCEHNKHDLAHDEKFQLHLIYIYIYFVDQQLKSRAMHAVSLFNSHTSYKSLISSICL
jgi:hypothetical protein